MTVTSGIGSILHERLAGPIFYANFSERVQIADLLGGGTGITRQQSTRGP